MANWKRVLISGSHFTVKELQISEIGAAQDNDTILFAASASTAGSGSIKTDSTFYIVNGGDLSGSFGTSLETSFEGDGTDITGIDSATTDFKLKGGAGVGILNAGGAESPYFGNQQGTFTIALKGASNYPGTIALGETYTQATVNLKNTGVNGGILFATHSNQVKLILDPDLPGNGLEWDPNYLNNDIGSVLRVQLDGTDGGSSGLLRTPNGLSISTNLGGISGVTQEGLEITNGILSMSLATNSGLEDSSTLTGQSGKLSLASSVAGNGLTFNAVNDRSIINIDTSVVVDNTVTIDFEAKAPGDGGVFTNTIAQGQDIANQFYGVIAASTNDVIGSTEYRDGSGTQTLISNPTVFFELSKVWGDSVSPSNADFSITGDVTIGGNLTILSSSNVVNIHADTFETSDPFILLNSGSDDISSAFTYNNGGIIVQTANPAGGAHGSALFFQSGSTHSVWGVTTADQVGWNDIHPGVTNGDLSGTSLSSNTEAIISTIAISNVNDPNDSLTEANVFWSDEHQERLGNWYIDTDADPAGGESNVWFYTA